MLLLQYKIKNVIFQRDFFFLLRLDAKLAVPESATYRTSIVIYYYSIVRYK